ncbi:MAG TPA: chemotaxis protein CheC [Terriglobia bacterium]|jgi:chemotaxis protein CheC
MALTEKQGDALAELINIGFARSAASLSELSGYRVLLDPPSIDVRAIEELPDALAVLTMQEVATVHQLFSGPVSGDALLILNYEGAVTLTDLLRARKRPSQRLDEASREALTEIGNILLNACLGMFGNMLHVHVSFSMPRLHLEVLDNLLKSIIIGSEELRSAIIVSTAFHIKESAVSGYLVIVLGVSSLDRLIRSIEEWEQRQSQ